MAVFPENMDRLDVQDPAKALSIIENYIGYMNERIEFAIRNVTKNVSAAGISSAELYILVQAQAQQIAVLQSTLSIIQGSITSLQHDSQTHTAEISALQTIVSAVQSSITAINDRLGVFSSTDPTIKATLDDFEQRISALENPS